MLRRFAKRIGVPATVVKPRYVSIDEGNVSAALVIADGQIIGVTSGLIWPQKCPIPTPLFAGVIHEERQGRERNCAGLKSVRGDDTPVHVIGHVSYRSQACPRGRWTVPNVRISERGHEQIVVVPSIAARGANGETISGLSGKGIFVLVGVEENGQGNLAQVGSALCLARVFVRAAGSSKAARIAMIPITISNSTRVNAAWARPRGKAGDELTFTTHLS